MNPSPEADRVLLAHVRECMDRIREYTNNDHARFDTSRLVQDAVIRNLQTLADAVSRMTTRLGPQR